MRKFRYSLNAVLAAGLLMGLIGLPGCSDSEAPPPADGAAPEPGSKRDAVQKANYDSLKGLNQGKAGAKGGRKGH